MKRQTIFVILENDSVRVRYNRSEKVLRGKNTLSQELLVAVEEVLTEHGLHASEVTLEVEEKGGGLTSARIARTVAQTWNWCNNAQA